MKNVLFVIALMLVSINICHIGMKHHPPSAGTSQNQTEAVQSGISLSTVHGFSDCLIQA